MVCEIKSTWWANFLLENGDDFDIWLIRQSCIGYLQALTRKWRLRTGLLPLIWSSSFQNWHIIVVGGHYTRVIYLKYRYFVNILQISLISQKNCRKTGRCINLATSSKTISNCTLWPKIKSTREKIRLRTLPEAYIHGTKVTLVYKAQ